MNKEFNFTMDVKRPALGRLRGIILGENVTFSAHIKDDGDDVVFYTTITYSIFAVYKTPSGAEYRQEVVHEGSPEEDTSVVSWLLEMDNCEAGINSVWLVIASEDGSISTMPKEFYVSPPFDEDEDGE